MFQWIKLHKEWVCQRSFLPATLWFELSSISNSDTYRYYMCSTTYRQYVQKNIFLERERERDANIFRRLWAICVAKIESRIPQLCSHHSLGIQFGPTWCIDQRLLSESLLGKDRCYDYLINKADLSGLYQIWWDWIWAPNVFDTRFAQKSSLLGYVCAAMTARIYMKVEGMMQTMQVMEYHIQ